MKNLFFVVAISLLLASCSGEPEQDILLKPAKGCQIVRNGKTVEIYSDGVLKAEFTERNTDSASLETLYYVEELVKENQTEEPEAERHLKRTLVMR